MRILLITVFVSLIFGFFAGFFAKNHLFQADAHSEPVIPTGLEQRIASGETIGQQERFIREELESLLADLSVTSDNPDSFINSRNEAVLKSLVIYHEVFPTYRDAVCDIDALQLYGGTGFSGIFQSCVTQINEDYIERLNRIRSTYIDDITASTTG